MRRNVRLRCAESEKPAACAASVSDAPAANISTARVSRSQRTYVRSESPICSTNKCRVRAFDRPRSEAASPRLTAWSSRVAIQPSSLAMRGSTRFVGTRAPATRATRSRPSARSPSSVCRASSKVALKRAGRSPSRSPGTRAMGAFEKSPRTISLPAWLSEAMNTCATSPVPPKECGASGATAMASPVTRPASPSSSMCPVSASVSWTTW